MAATLTFTRRAAGRLTPSVEPYLVGGGAVALFLAAWEWYGRSGLASPLLISTPSKIGPAAWNAFATGRVLPDLAVSGLEFLLGFGLSVALAVPLGLLAGWYKPVYFVLEPYLTVLYAVPRVALLPLILLWVGVGIESKMLMIFLSAFFPIIMTVIGGVQTIERDLVRVARSFRAPEAFIFRSIIVPGSVPFIATGLRLGLARGLVGLVVAELYASNQGIGFFMTLAASEYRTADLFFAVLLLGALGVAFDVAMTRIERRLDRWRPSVVER